MNFTEPLEEWSCESVAQWLAINDLSEHIENFLENRIDGEKLQNLDSNRLKVSFFDDLEFNFFCNSFLIVFFNCIEFRCETPKGQGFYQVQNTRP